MDIAHSGHVHTYIGSPISSRRSTCAAISFTLFDLITQRKVRSSPKVDWDANPCLFTFPIRFEIVKTPVAVVIVAVQAFHRCLCRCGTRTNKFRSLLIRWSIQTREGPTQRIEKLHGDPFKPTFRTRYQLIVRFGIWGTYLELLSVVERGYVVLWLSGFW